VPLLCVGCVRQPPVNKHDDDDDDDDDGLDRQSYKTDEASTKNVTTKNVVTMKPKRERKMHFVETQTRSTQIDSSKVL